MMTPPGVETLLKKPRSRWMVRGLLRKVGSKAISARMEAGRGRLWIGLGQVVEVVEPGVQGKGWLVVNCLALNRAKLLRKRSPQGIGMMWKEAPESWLIWKTEDKMGGSLSTCSLQSHLNNAFHGTSWPCSASLDNDIISMIPQVRAPALVSSLWLPVCQSGWEISFRLMGNPSSYPKAASALSSYDKFYPERSQHFLISSSFTEKCSWTLTLTSEVSPAQENWSDWPGQSSFAWDWFAFPLSEQLFQWGKAIW